MDRVRERKRSDLCSVGDFLYERNYCTITAYFKRRLSTGHQKHKYGKCSIQQGLNTLQYTLPLHGALPKMKDQDSICLTSYTTKDGYSLNLFQYIQPGFPLPSFHSSNKVDQSNNLAFTVFLQEMGCLVKTEQSDSITMRQKQDNLTGCARAQCTYSVSGR